MIDLDVVAGSQHVVVKEIAEGLGGRGALGGERVAHPGLLLDDDRERTARRILELDGAVRGSAAGHHVDAVGDDARERASTPVELGLAARLQRAHAVAARLGAQRDDAAPAGGQGELHLDVWGAARAEEAVLAGFQGTHAIGGLERELHVIGVVPLVVDVAGVAVRALRQLVECEHRALAHLAAWAKQIPTHPQESLLDGLEAQLDGLSLGHTPRPRERQRADSPHLHLLAREHETGQALRETVAVGRRFDGSHHVGAADPSARCQLRAFADKGGLPFAAGIRRRALGQRREGAFDLSEEARDQQNPANGVAGRYVDGVLASAAAVLGKQSQGRAEIGQGPVAKHAAVLEPLPVDPVDGLFFPGDSNGANVCARDVFDRAIRARRLGDLVPRQVRRLVEARRIRQYGPDGVNGAVKAPDPSLRSVSAFS